MREQPGVALHVGWQLRLVAGQAVQWQVAVQCILNAGRQHLECMHLQDRKAVHAVMLYVQHDCRIGHGNRP
jgi:L-ribulose-5-phosphate 3-epimerase UlaE